MCKEIVQIAVDTNKPLVIEDLDFREKKASLKEEGTKKYRRMLSSFAYALITSFIQSKAWREKIEVFKVNPAYTSIIGKVKFETRYGISGHQAAALTIARRFLGCSEKLPRHSVKIYNGKADPR